MLYTVVFNNIALYLTGKRNFGQRIKCPASQMPCHRVWWCPRTVSWPDGALPNWRKISWYQLLIHGRLCWQRLLFRWDSHITCCPQGELLQRHDSTDYLEVVFQGSKWLIICMWVTCMTSFRLDMARFVDYFHKANRR